MRSESEQTLTQRNNPMTEIKGDPTISALSEERTHKDLEKKDIILEGDIKLLNKVLDNIQTGVEEIKKKQDFTNGKVRKHQVWIAGIVGGSIVFMFFLSFFRDTLVGLVAEAVERRLTDKYIISIEQDK